MCRSAHEQCVTVGSSFGGQFGAEIAASAGTVVHDDLLADLIAEFLRNDAGDNVDPAARGRGRNHAHRFNRVRLS